jgi:hypothetical protein
MDPEKYGAPGGNRTPDPLLRRQTLYPLSYGRILGYSFHSTKVATPIRHLILPKSWSNLEHLELVER